MKTDFQLRRLCLNMIVKNEADRIERCLASVLPYISSYAITDTGSTDQTIGLIEDFFAEAKIPGAVHKAVFLDFAQARNEALENGRFLMNDPKVPYADYFLLVDADMELVVEDPEAFHNLTAEAYNVTQKAGAVHYPNTRLLAVHSKAKYIGVTHEYLDAPTGPPLAGAYFIDHADGSNRVDKFKRDIRLLNSALNKDPNNGRYWYYLAQSHRDAGDFKKAAECYKRRAAMPGWDEETWSAMVGYATALKDLGNDSEYVTQLLRAYEFRPTRAEPLYDLAKYFREKGQNRTALTFIETGSDIPKPADWLFVNQFVYEFGFLMEYAICAYYDEKQREAGSRVNDQLCLSKTAPKFVKDIARNNRYWYLEKLSLFAPSFQQTRLEFQVPHAGYTPMNPCVTSFDDMLLCNIRCVNYRMDNEGRYLINGTDGEANGTNPIDTKNFIVNLVDRDGKFNIEGYAREIVWPRPEPLFNLVTGMEDVRIYRDGNPADLWASATVREQNAGGVCQQVRFRLECDTTDMAWRVAKWSPMSGTDVHEKNWMPITASGHQFMYRLDRIVTAPPPVHPEVKHELGIDVSEICGGSQLVPFKEGWLAVVHESGLIPGTVRRFYQHRFAWFDYTRRLRRLSLPFSFQEKQIEFCAGLAWWKNQLVLSYGIRDNQAWIGTISETDVSAMLVDFHE